MDEEEGEAAEEKEVTIHCLPGIGKVKRNDVLVFHYPYPHSKDSLSMHLLKYYVKRCIALPDDIMGISYGCHLVCYFCAVYQRTAALYHCPLHKLQYSAGC